MFPFMWKLGLKNKSMCNTYMTWYERERQHGECDSVSVWGDYGRWERKKNNTEEIILKYIASVYEDSPTECFVSWWMIAEEDKRDRVSNRGS
jgi:hypothetical protein